MRGDVAVGAADGAPVAPGVFQQGVVLRQPHRARPALGQVVGDDAGDLPALAAAGAVAEEEALAELDRARKVVLDQDHLVRGVAEDPRARQDLGVGLAGIDHRLHLGVRHQGVVGDADGQDRAVGWRRRRDRGHGSGFHERGGVRPRRGEADAAERIGLVEADVVALARPGAGLVGQRRRRGEEGQPVRRRSQGPGAGRQDRDLGDRAELARLRGRPRLDGRGRLGRVGQGVGHDDCRDLTAGRATVDHQQARLDRRSVLSVGAGREGQPQADRTAGGERAQRRGVLEQPRRHDRRQPAAIGQTVQGRVQVRLQVLEGRVGEHSVEPTRPGEGVAKVARVLLAAGREGEEAFEQSRTAGGELVEGQGAAAGLGQDGQEAAAGRGLQHLVARADLGGEHGQGAELGRGGELVQRHLLLAAAGVGEAELGEVGQEGDDLGRRVLQASDLGREAADLQHQGRLDGVIGVAPEPGALRIRGAERHGHDVGHQLSVERTGPIELGRQGAGGGQEVGGLVVAGVGGEQGKQGVHRKGSRSPAAEGSSLQTRRARPSAPFLSLYRRPSGAVSGPRRIAADQEPSRDARGLEAVLGGDRHVRRVNLAGVGLGLFPLRVAVSVSLDFGLHLNRPVPGQRRRRPLTLSRRLADEGDQVVLLQRLGPVVLGLHLVQQRQELLLGVDGEIAGVRGPVGGDVGAAERGDLGGFGAGPVADHRGAGLAQVQGHGGQLGEQGHLLPVRQGLDPGDRPQARGLVGRPPGVEAGFHLAVQRRDRRGGAPAVAHA